MDIIAIKLTNSLEYVYNNMVRKSYNYEGNNYLPLNLEVELIEKDIEYEIVTYFLEPESDENLKGFEGQLPEINP